MKEELKLVKKVESIAGLEKFSTNVENVFVYKVQAGWNFPKSIRNNEKDNRSDSFKQKSIIILYSDYFNGEFCGQTEYLYGYGTKKYSLDYLIDNDYI